MAQIRSRALALLLMLLMALPDLAVAFPAPAASLPSVEPLATEAAFRRRLRRPRPKLFRAAKLPRTERQQAPTVLAKQKRKRLEQRRTRLAQHKILIRKIRQSRQARIAGRKACIGGVVNNALCLCPSGLVALPLQARLLACLPPGTVLANGMLQRPGKAERRLIRRLKRRFAPTELPATVPLTASAAELRDLARRNNVRIVQTWAIELTGKRVVRFRYRDARPLDTVRAVLQGEPLILSLQNNNYYERQSAASQPAPADQALPQYALARISAVEAQDISSGTGALVAVVDSGIDATHPDLKGKVAATFDATEGKSAITDPHGTEVAGLVAANGLLLGVAPDARLLDVRVFESLEDEDASAATSESLLRGLDWAVKRKANIINLSLTGPADPLLEEMMTAIAKRGIVVVAAAGNGGPEAEPAYPAAYDSVIAVTATGTDDRAYDQANRGSYIDVAAPGIDVLVTAPAGTYQFETGTSFAAAEVTGVIALMLGQDPGMSRDEIMSALERGARDLGSPGKDAQFGAGLVNALASLQITQ